LDIGCAAGYFVEYMKNLGWNAHGIDLSSNCIDAGKLRGLNLLCADYLTTEYDIKFDLITMWVTIEHLHRPENFLKKVYSDLNDDGVLYISTCRADGIGFMKIFGNKWRFYNFPEHLNFFSLKNIKTILKQNGFKVKKTVLYGSGIGNGKSLIKTLADLAAKYFRLGEMMLIYAVKISNKNNKRQ
jgi:2-polyprenyl-3-methyl-5-hydroxy-6-metoxy-1,4-benzoquinol methylase